MMKSLDLIKNNFNTYRVTYGGIIIVLALVLLELIHFVVPNSPALMSIVLVYVAFQNGLIPALIFTLILWMFTVFHFSLPGHFFHFNKSDLIRVITFAFAYPANAFMVGLLKNKLMDKIHDEKIMKEQMLSSAKMSSLGEMASGIAHEINNPLAIISVKCQQLRRLAIEKKISNEQVLKNTIEINQTIERMSKIIKGLKSFARDASHDDMEMVSLNSVIDSTLTLCHEKFNNNNVRLIYDLNKSSSLFLECRPTEISQVLLNLLNNANDAIENSEEKWIEIVTSENDDLISTSITDSGKAIPEKIRGSIMQPFFTTKEQGKGIGLGLSISLGIAKAHGGKLYLDEKCKNTRFVLEIPKKRNEAISTLKSVD